MKKCPYCAEEIQDEAKVCRFCQREVVSRLDPLPKDAPVKAKTSTGTKVILGLILGAVVLSIIGAMTGEPTKPAPTNAEGESLEERAQRLYEPMLRKALASDEKCDVTRMVYQGMDKKADEFYWSAACRSGKSTLVRANGTTGKITYLDCGVAASIGVKCFEPLTSAPSERRVR